MTFVLGLTGCIATGKSTASNFFKNRSIPVVDADKGAREVMKPGHTAYKKVVKLFGETIVNDDGTIDRKKLGSIVFNDQKKLSALNGIVHKDIYKWIQEQKDSYIREGHPLIVLDIPLLYESGVDFGADEIMVVATDRITQIERLMKRDNLSKNDALSRILSQESIDSKVDKADVVIDNNGTLEDTYHQLNAWLSQKGY